MLSLQAQKIRQTPKSRIIVLTDMGNEPDDSQTLVRLLMYANKLDIEGLIAVSSCHQYAGKRDSMPILRNGSVIRVDTIVKRRNVVEPSEIIKRIEAYGKVRDNLLKHEKGWPTTNELLQTVGVGPAAYGMRGVGKGNTTSGSRIIEEAIKKSDPRPLYFCINAGASCLAQALFDLRETTDPDLLAGYIEKIRVYDDAGQDDAGAWIAHTFPQLKYQRSQRQVFNFMNDKGPVTWDTAIYAGKAQHLWAKEHVQTGHGPLGKLYPTRMKWSRPDLFNTLEGGGTSTWIGHVNQGLFDPEEITWGGWGGRFKASKERNVLAPQLKYAGLEATEEPFKPFMMIPEDSDDWTDPITGKKYTGTAVPIFRWRRAYQNDFEARMDWCVKPFAQANHNPVAAWYDDTSDGIVFVEVKAGTTLALDATNSTDPDGDLLAYRWFVYPEAGNYPGELTISRHDQANATVGIPANAMSKQMHVILEVRDNNPVVPLYDYRRLIINVNLK